MKLLQEQAKALRLWQTSSFVNSQLSALGSLYSGRNFWQQTLLIFGLALFVFQLNVTVLYVALAWKFSGSIRTESDRWKARLVTSLMATFILLGLPVDFEIVPLFYYNDLMFLCLAVNIGGIGLRSGYECYKSRKIVKLSLIAATTLLLIISMVIAVFDL